MNKINFLRIIDIIQSIFYYGAIIIIPLSLSLLFPLFSPFTLIKSTWFYILASSFLLIVIISLRLDKKRMAIMLSLDFWKRLFPLLIIFVVFFVINLFSSNFQQSFFGSYDRQLGLMFYFWLLIWLILMAHYFYSSFPRNQDRVNFWMQGIKNTALLMMISSSLASVYAFLQFVGYDFVVWQEPQLLTRAIANLGQPNFLGSFLLFGLAMSAYLVSLYPDFRIRSLLLILTLLQILALTLSGSRSAWLAFIVVATILLFCLLWKRFRYKTIFFVLVFTLLTSLALYFLAPVRISSIFKWQEGSLGLRSYFYQAAPKIIWQQPFVGVGLENGGEAIVKQYQPDWGLFMRINGYSDKVHNSLLDTTIQTGFLGLFLYILLHVFVFRQWLSLWRKQIARPFALAAGSALLLYGITLFFGLSDLTNVFYFWILVGLIIIGNMVLSDNNSSSNLFFKKFKTIFSLHNRSEELSVFISVISGLLSILALVQIYFSFSSLKADHYFLNFYKQSLVKEYFAADLLYSYILNDALNPVNLSYYQRAYAILIVNDFDENLDIILRILFRERATDLFKNIQGSNYDSKHVLTQLKCFLQGPDLARMDFNLLKETSPQRPAIYFDQGNCEVANSSDALALYQEALIRLPNANDERLRGEHLNYFRFYSYLLNLKLANNYYNRGEYQQALSFYRQAYYFNPQDISILKNLANTYFYLGDYHQAYVNLEHAYIRQPHYYWLSQLAALSLALDNEELALEYWQKATNLSNNDFQENLDDLIFP